MVLGKALPADSPNSPEREQTADQPLAAAPIPIAPRSGPRLRRASAPASDARAPTWMRIEDAAMLLGLAVVTLRRAIERNARRDRDGRVHAAFDGIHARKIGRHWRVLLDECWRAAASP